MMTGMSEDREDIAPVLTITPEARATVLEVLANEAEPTRWPCGSRSAARPTAPTPTTCTSRRSPTPAAGDVVQPDDELPVVVPSASVDRLQGATPRLRHRRLGRGRPGHRQPQHARRPPTLAGLASIPEVDLSDPFAQRVVVVLEEQVNPSIASHGGRADLVAVEDSSVYLRLSGGCQGCGMAKATLSQGIEVILREAIPEIANVVDVTDHADGTNPYYEPAHSRPARRTGARPGRAQAPGARWSSSQSSVRRHAVRGRRLVVGRRGRRSGSRARRSGYRTIDVSTRRRRSSCVPQSLHVLDRDGRVGVAEQAEPRRAQRGHQVRSAGMASVRPVTIPPP